MSQEPEIGDVAEAYDCWATTYDTDQNVTRDLAATVLRHQEFALAGRDVLEIGCGTGTNTVWLAAHARHVVACDISAGMLQRARARAGPQRAWFVRCDIRARWPLSSACMDLVIGSLVLEHVEALEPIFRQAFRVLRPGGECFVCELHPFRQIAGGQAQFTRAGSGEAVRVPAFVHDVSDYVNAAVEAGFRRLRTADWRDAPDAPRSAAPRLFAMMCRREGNRRCEHRHSRVRHVNM